MGREFLWEILLWYFLAICKDYSSLKWWQNQKWAPFLRRGISKKMQWMGRDNQPVGGK
jgi:hypothetical protein